MLCQGAPSQSSMQEEKPKMENETGPQSEQARETGSAFYPQSDQKPA